MSIRDLSIIRAHFGEELALYLAFINLSIRVLLPVSLVGVLLFVVCTLAPSLTGGYTHLAPFFVTAMIASATDRPSRAAQRSPQVTSTSSAP